MPQIAQSRISLQVLNIDTNAIQPLTLESIAKGTSVNQALQEPGSSISPNRPLTAFLNESCQTHG